MSFMFSSLFNKVDPFFWFFFFLWNGNACEFQTILSLFNFHLQTLCNGRKGDSYSNSKQHTRLRESLFNLPWGSPGKRHAWQISYMLFCFIFWICDQASFPQNSFQEKNGKNIWRKCFFLLNQEWSWPQKPYNIEFMNEKMLFFSQ